MHNSKLFCPDAPDSVLGCGAHGLSASENTVRRPDLSSRSKPVLVVSDTHKARDKPEATGCQGPCLNLSGMRPTQRLYDRGTALGERRLRELAEEFKHARLRLGLSQQEVADAARIDRSTYSRLERGKLATLSILASARVGAVLGLDLSVRTFPGGRSVRDAGQARGLSPLLECVAALLAYRLEVVLPPACAQRQYECRSGPTSTNAGDRRKPKVSAERRAAPAPCATC